MWKKVLALDLAELDGGFGSFSFRAILIWSIHDLPTYGLFSGQVTKGYKGCPTCGPNTCARHSKLLGKTIYIGHRRWLQVDHPF